MAALAGFWLLTGVGCWLASRRWQLGLYAAILLTLLQDTVRKLTPGAPSVVFLGVISVLLVTWVSLLVKQRGWWRPFHERMPYLGWSILAFGLACLPAFLISWTYGDDTWLLPVFGGCAYGLLLAAMVMGYFFPRGLEDIRRLLVFYCLLSVPMLVGGYLEFFDLWPGSRLIGTDVLKMLWHRLDSYNGTMVYLIAGFYRSPDVMGWHAATVTMLSFLLWSTSADRCRWLWLLAGAFALGALLLCGRRKMAYMVPLFALLVPLLWMLAGNAKIFVFRFFVVVVLLVALVIALPMLGKRLPQVGYYFGYLEDVPVQFQRHAFSSVIATYRQSGFFGRGIGVATPGSQHLHVDRPKAWQESGPTRVMVELGVPGFSALAGLLVVLLGYGVRSVRQSVVRSHHAAGYAVSLFACFVVNLASLLVSGQILADPLVSTFLGLTIGLVFVLGHGLDTERPAHKTP